ncbi:hypothetical protein [Thalassotalea eurytherma]|uniref:Uncharacterized protein n=1 Tax=Thalassotalea eurytherma TaxID=1144278 RepID=A0ABQ6H3X3_9GAMM|nr:hypothetical protein [Thalassotalea eurytherma]GLX81497.1 hypothetical protein theurythT_09490 [Thalassotalea eurytherma]
MNEYNVANLMNSSFCTDEKFFPSEEPITAVPLSIILRKLLVKEKQMLDVHIRQILEQVIWSALSLSIWDDSRLSR